MDVTPDLLVERPNGADHFDGFRDDGLQIDARRQNLDNRLELVGAWYQTGQVDDDAYISGSDFIKIRNGAGNDNIYLGWGNLCYKPWQDANNLDIS